MVAFQSILKYLQTITTHLLIMEYLVQFSYDTNINLMGYKLELLKISRESFIRVSLLKIQIGRFKIFQHYYNPLNNFLISFSNKDIK